MYVAFALLADSANVTADGKLNILGVFDAVRVATLPTVHPRVHLVARMKAQAGDVGVHRLGLQVTGPGGNTLLGSEAEVTIGALPAGVSEIDLPLVQVFDLPLEQAGPHAVTLVLDGRVIVQLPMSVMGGSAPGPAPVFHPPAAGALLS